MSNKGNPVRTKGSWGAWRVSEEFEFIIKESNMLLDNQMYVSPRGFVEINGFIDRYIELQEKLQAEREKVALLREAVESYASFEDGKYHGPGDIYEDIGEVARQALEELKEIEGEE